MAKKSAVKERSFEAAFNKISDLLSSYKKIIVGFSGGMDSHVLLHMFVTLYKKKSQVVALHVDHGVNPNSKRWVKHCQKVCKNLGIECIDEAVSRHCEERSDEANQKNKCSPEEILRNLRYDVFTKFLPRGACIVTAHHANDQAETLLLQLFRGSGVKGLAAISEKIKFARGALARPLLDLTRDDLEQYAKEHKLKWIEDESNLDTKFDRNFVRHKLLPLIQKKWPGVVASLNRAANNCAEADQLLEILAEEDLSRHPRESGDPENIINIKQLKKLSRIRQKNVIRFWLKKLNLTLPNEVKLNEIMENVIDSRYDATPIVSWCGGQVRRFRSDLCAMLPLPSHDSAQVLYFKGRSLKLPGDSGVLKINSSFPKKRGSSNIIGDPCCLHKKLKVCFRQGGEKIKIPGRRTRYLKKLMQEWNIPPWQRDRIPIVYYDEEIIAVIGYYSVDWIAFQVLL